MENNIKQRTLRRHAEYQNLKKNGKRYFPRPWLLINYKQNEQGYLRFGLTVSAKVGPAVTRNKLKRWCKEYFRKTVRNGFDIGLDVNVVFKSVDREFYRKIEHKDLDRGLDRFFANLK